MVVNLDKREFVDPHKLGTGLKLWEQLANHPGTSAALIILCAAMPQARGGGDLDLDQNWHGPERTFPEHGATPGPMPEDYAVIAKRTVGRWAGNRIALVGDYAEIDDLPKEDNADLIYGFCRSGTDEDDTERLAWYERRLKEVEDEDQKAEIRDKIARLKVSKPYTDISEDVCLVIEHELQGKFEGSGVTDFVYDSDKEKAGRVMKPDMIIGTMGK